MLFIAVLAIPLVPTAVFAVFFVGAQLTMFRDQPLLSPRPLLASIAWGVACLAGVGESLVH